MLSAQLTHTLLAALSSHHAMYRTVHSFSINICRFFKRISLGNSLLMVNMISKRPVAESLDQKYDFEPATEGH
jgi:hypothetical protein